MKNTVDIKQYSDWYQKFRTEGCQRCSALCASRTQVVISRRNSFEPIDLLVIGEAPGAEEDLKGLPFVGASGKLLDKEYLNHLPFSYAVTNLVKCRPENNRPPTKEEIDNCFPYLTEQIRLLSPKLLILLGRTVITKFFPETFKEDMKELVNTKKDYKNTPCLLFYHPSYILRNGADSFNKMWYPLLSTTYDILVLKKEK